MKVTVHLEVEDNEVASLLRRIIPGIALGEPVKEAGAPNDCYTREEYAALRKVAPRTVSTWFAEGQVKGFKIGRRLYIYKNQQ